MQLFAATINKVLNVPRCLPKSAGMLLSQVLQSLHLSEHISPALRVGCARVLHFSLGTRQALSAQHVFMCCTRRMEHGPAPERNRQ